MKTIKDLKISCLDKWLLEKYKPRISSHGYVVIGRKYLHSLIMKPEKGYQVDHINGDKLDNRRINLRIVTPTQNAMNKKGFSKHGWKGVCFDKRRGIFRAIIKFKDKQLYLGQYSEAQEAHLAYCMAAILYFGDYASGGY